MLENFTTFKTSVENNILRVSFDYLEINVLGIEMMKDLEKLTDILEKDKEIKVIIFESRNEKFFIAHADIDMLQYLPVKKVLENKVEVNDLARILNKITKLPQISIAKIEGYARGGGHELAQACDMRFASPNAIFMQMECGMGILPCGGGTTRLARQVGLAKALEIILTCKDFNAYEAEKYGSINKVIEADKIDEYVYNIAARISKFNIDAINACKKTIYHSVNNTIDETLKYETFQLYEATSKTPAIRRFKFAAKSNFQNILYNQKNFETLLIDLQNIK